MNMDQVGRTIEFRAWYKGGFDDLEDYEKPQMIYNVQNLYDGRGVDTNPILGGFSSFGELLQDERFIVLEFTGLLDKYENKIWEGDIVRCGYGVGQVIFHQGSFMIEWLSDPEANMEFVSSRNGFSYRKGEEELEVIGDIFTYKK